MVRRKELKVNDIHHSLCRMGEAIEKVHDLSPESYVKAYHGLLDAKDDDFTIADALKITRFHYNRLKYEGFIQ